VACRKQPEVWTEHFVLERSSGIAPTIDDGVVTYDDLGFCETLGESWFSAG